MSACVPLEDRCDEGAPAHLYVTRVPCVPGARTARREFVRRLWSACSFSPQAAPPTMRRRPRRARRSRPRLCHRVRPRRPHRRRRRNQRHPRRSVSAPLPRPPCVRHIGSLRRASQRVLLRCPSCDTSTIAVARASPLLDRNVARINEWQAGWLHSPEPRQVPFRHRECRCRHRRSHRHGRDVRGRRQRLWCCRAQGRAERMSSSTTASRPGRDQWQFRLDADGVWRAFELQPLGPTESSDVCASS